MSWQRPILNRWLRWTERPALARARTPAALRRNFEFKAKVFFRGPGGVVRTSRALGDGEALWVRPKGCAHDRVILYFHGGGYVFGSPRTHAAMVSVLAEAAGMQAVLVAYPLAPEHQFPAPVDRAEDAYFALIAQGIAPSRIVMGGDSAGGGLVLALLGRLAARGAQMPAGVFAFSPLTDLTFSGASMRVNAEREVMLPSEGVDGMAARYLGAHDPTDPEASPLFADFTGAPPIWIAVGDTEILLDDTRRIVPRMKAQGVDVQMHIAHDLPHVWPLFHNLLPEARQTLRDLAAWITRATAGPHES